MTPAENLVKRLRDWPSGHDPAHVFGMIALWAESNPHALDCYEREADAVISAYYSYDEAKRELDEAWLVQEVEDFEVANFAKADKALDEALDRLIDAIAYVESDSELVDRLRQAAVAIRRTS